MYDRGFFWKGRVGKRFEVVGFVEKRLSGD